MGEEGLASSWRSQAPLGRQPKDQRYANAYLFGAVCPARDVGSAIVMPFADTSAMQAHLDDIGRHVMPGAHALVLLDKAGWHTTGKLALPANLTLIHLPPRSPELNPTENIWQYLRQTWLSNRVFDSYAHICDACCEAWNKLTAEAGRIASIATRKWAVIGQRP